MGNLTKTDINNLSISDLLINLLLSSNNTEINTIRSAIETRTSKGETSNPVYTALISATNHPNVIKDVYKNSRECKLFNDVIKNKSKAPGFSGYAKSVTAKNNNLNRVALLCLIIERIYSIYKTNSIKLTTWKQIIGGLKSNNGKYKTDLSEHHLVAARRLAILLSAHHNNPEFKIIASNRKNTSRYGTASLDSLLTDENMHKWHEFFTEYLNTMHLKSTKFYLVSFKLFLIYLQKYSQPLNPLEFLSKQNSPTFWDYLTESEETNPQYKLRVIYDFTNWIIENRMTETEDGESVTIGIPIITSHKYAHINKTTSNATKPIESVKLAPPTSWLFLIKDILTKNDFEWPKTVTKDYFDFYNKDTNSIETIWCPVNAYIFLTMLELPIRKIQVISSDSGEGDVYKYDNKERKWIKNDNAHAGYWKKIGAKRINRGIISKLPSTHPSFAGFYINTNKTQDIDVGFTELSGYTIPWNNEILIKYLANLREWQEKYNPVTHPTKFSTIAKPVFQTTPTKSALSAIPDRFYLFRHPSSYRGQHPDSPPTHNQINYFWLKLMEELEKRLNQLGENVKIITHNNESTGQPDASIFSVHGLRVAGLTAFAEAGVPIEILSKIVAGHSSILMTIYYIKYNAAHITDMLDEAQRGVELTAQKNFQQWLKNTSWEEAKRYTAYNSTDGLSFAINNTSSVSVWGGSSLGLCPYGGTRCDNGGEVIRKNKIHNKENNVYGAVPGGQGNCVRCRHFITGTPWMIPLWLHGNKLLSQARKESIELDELKSENDKLCIDRYNYVKNANSESIPQELVKRINTNDAIIESKAKTLDETLLNAHSTYNLLEKVRAIASANRSKDVGDNNAYINNDPLILISDTSEIDFKETSRFIELDFLVQAGRFYEHIRDKDEERERNNFLDQILFNNNINPISFSNLTETEKSIAADAAAKFLIAKLNADEIENLHSGHVTLDSLGIGSGLQKTLTLIHESQSLNSINNTTNLLLESSKYE